MSSRFADLASTLLDEKERKLAVLLGHLLSQIPYDASPLVVDIMPTYYEGNQTLEPDPVYRPLMYLDSYGTGTDFARVTRIFIENTCWHIEGCLKVLADPHPRFRSFSGPFGPLVIALRNHKVIPPELAEQLLIFNKTIYVPAHHPSALYTPRSDLYRSSFTALEAAQSFVVMRKLSIPLFKLLAGSGVHLPHDWKDFDDNWLSWQDG